MRAIVAVLCMLLPFAARAQPAPALQLQVSGAPVSVFPGGWPACDANDIPDAPARAIRLADGTVELFASDQTNRINTGPDLLHQSHQCGVVYRGGWNDDPARFDDRTWIATPWTDDGKTIWAILHNEFHGSLRKGLCPTERYLDCWYNALTLARSSDGGRHFQRVPGDALVAVLPYRYDQLGPGHHGYFNPSNIVRHDGADFMFAFATKAGAQREGNCLLRTDRIADPAAWRGWDGAEFTISFANPYTHEMPPEQHVCAPVGIGALRWPVTGLVRHAPSGIYIAVMQDMSRTGGVFYSTSRDLLHWSPPAKLFSAPGLPGWRCGDDPPIFYPALIDAASADRNFQTVGDTPSLFLTRFDLAGCRITSHRDLMRWRVRILITSGSRPSN